MSTIRKFLKKFVNNPFYVFFCISERANLNWIPDELFLKLLYRSNLGKKADLKNPKSFNEKLQWLKLYDRKDIYTTMVDKYAAKQYVTEIMGEEYVIPTLVGVRQFLYAGRFDAYEASNGYHKKERES